MMRKFSVKSPMNLSLWEGGEIDIDALISFTVDEGAVEVTRFQFSKLGYVFADAPKEIVRRFESDPSFYNWLISEADEQLAYERDDAADAKREERRLGL